MKELAKKISAALRAVFGYGIMVCVFAGGFTFFGYLFALCIGGETAHTICTYIYKSFFPVIIKTTTFLVILGLVVMYLNGEVALTISADKKKRRQYKTKNKKHS